MKKFILSLVTLLYMGVSTGIAMEIHYCMGKLAGIDFFHEEKEICGRCGMVEKKGGCCSDEHKFYKLSDSHKNTTVDFVSLAPEWTATEPAPVYRFEPVFLKQDIQLPRSQAPPPDTGLSLNILHCVFRI